MTYKIHTNRRNVRLRVRVVGKSKQQTRLSDTRVSNQEQLEEIIAVETNVSVCWSTCHLSVKQTEKASRQAFNRSNSM